MLLDACHYVFYFAAGFWAQAAAKLPAWRPASYLARLARNISPLYHASLKRFARSAWNHRRLHLDDVRAALANAGMLDRGVRSGRALPALLKIRATPTCMRL